LERSSLSHLDKRYNPYPSVVGAFYPRDLTDPPSILKALDGIDKMFLLIGSVGDEFTQGVTAYGLARRASLKHITYLSVMQADRFLDVPHFAAKAAIEHTIKNYDVPFTILRPGYFMQNEARLKDLLIGQDYIRCRWGTPVLRRLMSVTSLRRQPSR
jgi:uncharacterized protein YbjT (DUF2867 family)